MGDKKAQAETGQKSKVGDKAHLVEPREDELTSLAVDKAKNLIKCLEGLLIESIHHQREVPGRQERSAVCHGFTSGSVSIQLDMTLPLR